MCCDAIWMLYKWRDGDVIWCDIVYECDMCVLWSDAVVMGVAWTWHDWILMLYAVKVMWRDISEIWVWSVRRRRHMVRYECDVISAMWRNMGVTCCDIKYHSGSGLLENRLQFESKKEICFERKGPLTLTLCLTTAVILKVILTKIRLQFWNLQSHRIGSSEKKSKYHKTILNIFVTKSSLTLILCLTTAVDVVIETLHKCFPKPILRLMHRITTYWYWPLYKIKLLGPIYFISITKC